MPPASKIRSRVATSLLLCGLLSGCAEFSLEELRQAESAGSPFQRALSNYYLAFAESEAEQFDWLDVRHFADKGLLAAYGSDTAPEDPANWNVPEAMLPELMAGYEKLMSVLTPAKRTAEPELTAHAQYLYDCWVEQQEENWQLDDIAACREGFYRIIDKLENLSPPEKAPRPLISASAYIVFFDWNSTTLTSTAQQVIDTVVTDLKMAGQYDVVLNSHADRSGSTKYNLELSQRRAEAVRRALIKEGIPADRITFYAFGESDTRIPTEDGTREQGNRRVEIYLDQ